MCIIWYITLVDNAIIHIHSPAIHFIVKSEINVKLLEIIINHTFVFLITLLKSSLLVIASFKAMGTSQPPWTCQLFR